MQWEIAHFSALIEFQAALLESSTINFCYTNVELHFTASSPTQL